MPNNLTNKLNSSSIFLLGREDAPQISALEKSCFATGWDVPMYERVLLPQKVALVQLEKNSSPAELPSELFVVGYFVETELLGYVSMRVILSIHCAEIYNVAVKESQRKQGIAHKLLSRSIAFLAKLGVSEMNLEVRAGNVPAISLYTRNGFVACGVRKKYYPDGEDALLMERMENPAESP